MGQDKDLIAGGVLLALGVLLRLLGRPARTSGKAKGAVCAAIEQHGLYPISTGRAVNATATVDSAKPRPGMENTVSIDRQRAMR